MPKNTINFLRHVAMVGVSYGCVSEMSKQDRQTVLDDLKYVQGLREQALNLRAMITQKKALLIRLSKATCSTG
jgi:hypothetical protein